MFLRYSRSMISFTLTLVVCCEAGSYALAQSQDKGTPEPVELQVSRTLEIEIGPQERKSFSISMTGGTYARALIDQNGADLSVSVISPEKKLLAEVDQEKTCFDPPRVHHLGITPRL